VSGVTDEAIAEMRAPRAWCYGRGCRALCSAPVSRLLQAVPVSILQRSGAWSSNLKNLNVSQLPGGILRRFLVRRIRSTSRRPISSLSRPRTFFRPRSHRRKSWRRCGTSGTRGYSVGKDRL